MVAHVEGARVAPVRLPLQFHLHLAGLPVPVLRGQDHRIEARAVLWLTHDAHAVGPHGPHAFQGVACSTGLVQALHHVRFRELHLAACGESRSGNRCARPVLLISLLRLRGRPDADVALAEPVKPFVEHPGAGDQVGGAVGPGAQGLCMLGIGGLAFPVHHQLEARIVLLEGGHHPIEGGGAGAWLGAGCDGIQEQREDEGRSRCLHASNIGRAILFTPCGWSSRGAIGQ